MDPAIAVDMDGLLGFARINGIAEIQRLLVLLSENQCSIDRILLACQDELLRVQSPPPDPADNGQIIYFRPSLRGAPPETEPP